MKGHLGWNSRERHANGDVNFKFIPRGIDRILGIEYHPELEPYMNGRLAEEVHNTAAGHLDLYNAFQRRVYLYLGSLFNPKAVEGEFDDVLEMMKAVIFNAGQ